MVKDGSVEPINTAFTTLHANAAAISDLSLVRNQLQKAVDKKLKLTLTMDHSKLPMDHSMMMGVPAGGIEWDDDMPDMNKMSDNENVVWKFVDEQTKKENMAINWSLSKGNFTRIIIYNDPNSMHPMQHPIHFHGQRFVVASVDGKPSMNLVWKDTTLIPAGKRVDIILEPSNPGDWMAHCHIAEHLEASMMFHFTVTQ